MVFLISLISFWLRLLSFMKRPLEIEEIANEKMFYGSLFRVVLCSVNHNFPPVLVQNRELQNVLNVHHKAKRSVCVGTPSERISIRTTFLSPVAYKRAR